MVCVNVRVCARTCVCPQKISEACTHANVQACQRMNVWEKEGQSACAYGCVVGVPAVRCIGRAVAVTDTA